jgi:ATP-binding cassette, subfamily C (CFTR/MRP), member 1
LDDCFSGLDATTEDRIFHRLLGRNGLLRKSGTTVILVTHAAHRLSFADNILVLGAGGQIAEQGTFGYLMQHGTYVPGLAAKHKTEYEDQAVDKPLAVVDSYRNPAEDDEIARAAEDVNRQVGDWSTYLYYIRSCGLGNTICFLGGVVGFGVFMKMPGMSALCPSVRTLDVLLMRTQTFGSLSGRRRWKNTAIASTAFTLASSCSSNSFPSPVWYGPAVSAS